MARGMGQQLPFRLWTCFEPREKEWGAYQGFGVSRNKETNKGTDKTPDAILFHKRQHLSQELRPFRLMGTTGVLNGGGAFKERLLFITY